MDSKQKFLSFIESVRTESNNKVLDTIVEGFTACFEGYANEEDMVVIKIQKTIDGEFLPVMYNNQTNEVEDKLEPCRDFGLAKREAEAWSNDTNTPIDILNKRAKKPVKQIF